MTSCAVVLQLGAGRSARPPASSCCPTIPCVQFLYLVNEATQHNSSTCLCSVSFHFKTDAEQVWFEKCHQDDPIINSTHLLLSSLLVTPSRRIEFYSKDCKHRHKLDWIVEVLHGRGQSHDDHQSADHQQTNMQTEDQQTNMQTKDQQTNMQTEDQQINMQIKKEKTKKSHLQISAASYLSAHSNQLEVHFPLSFMFLGLLVTSVVSFLILIIGLFIHHRRCRNSQRERELGALRKPLLGDEADELKFTKRNSKAQLEVTPDINCVDDHHNHYGKRQYKNISTNNNRDINHSKECEVVNNLKNTTCLCRNVNNNFYFKRTNSSKSKQIISAKIKRHLSL
ncbi:hypothetical protein HELRODRAFT_172943 [Helobdella robusta]|uniref:Uncharacterized protein n=1 Tax=Helobdella robusta TaxID=6412 RepID=T1F666_HELRO|nr:hypothetical protein HELRODRAFT_172943 [Helobdella robusta]ESO03915.1 hypothetical protein HELRODRAFT_172943 [Helobdella robusta]